MRTMMSTIGGVAGALISACGSMAMAQTVSMIAGATGAIWSDDSGGGSYPTAWQDYGTGFVDVGGVYELRSYFRYNLIRPFGAPANSVITGATLRLYSGDDTSPIDGIPVDFALRTCSANGLFRPTFASLGSGTVISAYTFDGSAYPDYIDLPINAAGLAALNAMPVNSTFYLAGTVARPPSFVDQHLAFSGTELQPVFLDLTWGVVPTPGAAALLGIGGVLASRRRRDGSAGE